MAKKNSRWINRWRTCEERNRQISKYMHGIKGKHFNTVHSRLHRELLIALCSKKYHVSVWTHLFVLKVTIYWIRSRNLMEAWWCTLSHVVYVHLQSQYGSWNFTIHNSNVSNHPLQKNQGTQHFHALKSWKPQLLEGPESSFATVSSFISSLVLQSLLCQPFFPSLIKFEQTHFF